jgi:hypothetical protein
MDSDVWAMDVTTDTWTQLSPIGDPPAGRGYHVAAYDPTRDEATVFGGGDLTTDDSNFTCWGGGTPVRVFRNDTWSLSFNPDIIPPAAVTDLYVVARRNGAQLYWSAPGDDGNVGTATQYLIKYSTSAITSLNFDAITTQIPAPVPGAAGTNQAACFDGLTSGTPYWFALKTADEAGNWSEISNVQYRTTPATGPILICEVPEGGPNSVRPAMEDDAVPFALALSSANPAVDRAQFTFSVPSTLQGAPLRFVLFDLLGRQVRVLASGTSVAGRTVSTWDLTDDSGVPVHAGAYFARLMVGNQQLTKTILVR